MARSRTPTPEALQLRARQLYRLQYGTHEDLLFVSPLTRSVVRVDDRLLFSAESISRLAVISRQGDAVTAHTEQGLAQLRQGERELQSDLIRD